MLFTLWSTEFQVWDNLSLLHKKMHFAFFSTFRRPKYADLPHHMPNINTIINVAIWVFSIFRTVFLFGTSPFLSFIEWMPVRLGMILEEWVV